MLDGGFIHRQKGQRRLIIKPHGQGIVLKQETILLFLPLENLLRDAVLPGAYG